MARDRDLPSLNAIRMFEAAARELNFTQAADGLNVTQGAVSRQIKLLEEELGELLFHRDGPRLTLTPAGQEYRLVVVDALRIIRQGTARLRQRDDSLKLTLSVLPSFASRWLVSRFEAFQVLNPELKIWLGTSYEKVDFSQPGDVDVAIRFGRGIWPEAHVETLVEEQLSPVCAPEFAERMVEPRDLLEFKLLCEEPPWDEWHRWLSAEALGGSADMPAYSSDFSVLLQAATEGQGIALGRDLLVADDLNAGRLVRPFARGIRSDYHYYFVCSPERIDAPEIQTFLAWLRGEMQETVRQTWATGA